MTRALIHAVAAAALLLMPTAGHAATTAGTPDPSFGTGGLVVNQFGSGSSPHSAAKAGVLQADGKVVLALVAGDRSGGGAGIPMAAARLLPDGSPDPSFGSGGLASLPSAPVPNDFTNALAIQPDGKVLVVGQTAVDGRPGVAVARLTSAGVPDPDFGTAGRALLQPGLGGSPTSEARAVAIQPDGKIIVAGWSSDTDGHQELFVARLHGADGELDLDFGSAGFVRRQLALQPAPAPGVYPASAPGTGQSSLVLQPDGKIVAAGYAMSNDGPYEIALARFSGDDGSPDAGFGDGGVVRDQVNGNLGGSSTASAIALARDGKLVVTGTFIYHSTGQPRAFVARYSAIDGAPDTSFGFEGKATNGFAPYESEGRSIAVDNHDRLVVAGRGIPGMASDATYRLFVSRLGDQNFRDATFPTFPSEGWLTDFGLGDSEANGVLLGAGTVTAVGATAAGGNTQVGMVRLLANTSPRARFSHSSPLPQAVEVDAGNSSDPDGTIVAYDWDFGDGATATGVKAAHAYGASGTYRVTLTVTDDDGATETTSADVPVTVFNTVTPGPVVARPAPGAGIVGRPVVRGAVATLKVRCGPANATASCRVVARLLTRQRLAGRRVIALTAATRRRTRVVSLAGLRRTIAAGSTATVSLKLNRAGRKLLRKFRRVPARFAVDLMNSGRAQRAGAPRIVFRRSRR